jgi:hypothetical protein
MLLLDDPVANQFSEESYHHRLISLSYRIAFCPGCLHIAAIVVKANPRGSWDGTDGHYTRKAQKGAAKSACLAPVSKNLVSGVSAKAAHSEHRNELTKDSTYTVPDHSPDQLSSNSSCTKTENIATGGDRSGPSFLGVSIGITAKSDLRPQADLLKSSQVGQIEYHREQDNREEAAGQCRAHGSEGKDYEMLNFNNDTMNSAAQATGVT